MQGTASARRQVGLIYRDLPERKRKRPRRRTGSGRVRERLDAVEIPLKRTNQSQKARQTLLVSLIEIYLLNSILRSLRRRYETKVSVVTPSFWFGQARESKRRLWELSSRWDGLLACSAVLEAQ